MFKNKKLLDSSDDEYEGEGEIPRGRNNNVGKNQQGSSGNELKINKSYAENYDRWRSSEETQKLKDRYGADALEGDDSESSSSDDSDIFDEEKEKEFLRTLSLLKNKDSRIYDESSKFFKERNADKQKKSEENGDSGNKSKKKDNKPYLLKDHDREMVLKEQADGFPEDENTNFAIKNKAKPDLPYYQELSNIKKGFSDVLKDIDSDDEDGTLLRKRTVTASEKEQEENDYRSWLKGQLDNIDEKSNKGVKEMQCLKEIWSSPTLPEDEKFLRDYVLNRGYEVPEEEKKAEYIPTYDEIVHDSDEGGLSGDEKFEEEREKFEHKYNFRYEEPDQEFIKRYPRTVAETLRRADEKRKKQRELLKEQRESKKERKRDEIQRFKSMKRKEIFEKLQKLQEITGDPDLPVNDVDIDGDFDPDEHDRRMSQLFSDNYYGNADDEKPVFPSDEELDEANWDEWMPEEENTEDKPPEMPLTKKQKKKLKHQSQAADNENTDLNMDADYDKPSSSKRTNSKDVVNELIEASKRRSRKIKPSVFLNALEKKKPKFDPRVHETFQQYFDEYYQLDFEDLVGDMPCRFKYRKVTPNDFGLTTDEILKAPDHELNQWASVKKTFQYRNEDEEAYELQAYKKKAADLKRKKRILSSLYDESNQAEPDEVKTEEESKSSKSKRKRKKKNKTQKNICQAQTEPDEPTLNDVEEDIKVKIELPSEQDNNINTSAKPKKKKKKNKSNGSVNFEDVQIKEEKVDPHVGESRTVEKISVALESMERNAKIESMDGKSGKKNLKRPHESDDVEKKNKKKKAFNEKRKQTGSSKQIPHIPVDDDRLRAYGINPTKFKKRMKYGKHS